ncbi:MAG: selenium metabolism-associated LysR family transcriptional regulator [Candidatus Velthaea sp.]
MEPRSSALWSNVNISLLTTFVRVVETGNFSAAARSLYLAQSVVSAQVASLNRLAGTALLERVSGRWQTTAAGAVLHKRALELLTLVEQTQRDLLDATDRVLGHLTIASTRTITDALLANILHAFSGAHPDIRVDIKAGNREEAERWISNDEVDLGLVAMPLGIKGLTIHPFATDELVLVLPKNHPLANRETLSLEDLDGHPLVGFERGSGVRALLEERLAGRYAELDVRLELNSNDALLSCVERGIGLTFLPFRTAMRWAKCGQIVTAQLTSVDLRRELACVIRKERACSKAATTFIAWLTESYREEPNYDASFMTVTESG